MVGIVLGILAALVAGAVLAFVAMKHLRKKKKGGCSPFGGPWSDLLVQTGFSCGWEFREVSHKSFNRNIPGVAWDVRVLGLMI